MHTLLKTCLHSPLRTKLIGQTYSRGWSSKALASMAGQEPEVGFIRPAILTVMQAILYDVLPTCRCLQRSRDALVLLHLTSE